MTTRWLVLAWLGIGACSEPSTQIAKHTIPPVQAAQSAAPAQVAAAGHTAAAPAGHTAAAPAAPAGHAPANPLLATAPEPTHRAQAAPSAPALAAPALAAQQLAQPAAPSAPAASSPAASAPAASSPAASAPASSPAASGHDFIESARILYRIAACADPAAAAERVSQAFIKRHCTALERDIAAYRAEWLDKAIPFFAQVVPADLPTTVVYPFAGGDLITALTVFPRARELTTLSLEPAGDPRPVDELRGVKLERTLDELRGYIHRFLTVNHSRTDHMDQIMTRGVLPAHTVFTLIALKVHGYEPVSLRYFTLSPAGEPIYITLDDVAAPPQGQRQTRVDAERKQRNLLFANMELTFQPVGGNARDVRVYRHIRGNLADSHLGKDERVLRHLQAKGRVSAMTKAASYLLWWDTFSMIRNYLLQNMVWMVSDATGIPPRYAAPAGFEQLTWGMFEEPILNNPGPAIAAELRGLWKRNPQRALPILFGYRDRSGNSNLMITRKPITAASKP